jgi:GNAT superfamily N-acetyltransferase
MCLQSSTIRPAEPDNLDLLVGWGRALHEVERAFEPQLTYDEDQARKRYGDALHDPQTLFLIAELAAQPVGYLYAYLADAPEYFAARTKHCIIEVVYLEPQARGYGIVRELIARCSEWARAAGASRLIAGIYAANESSIKVFAGQGFAPYHVTMVHDFDDDNR